MNIKVIDNFADIETQLKIIKNLNNENLYAFRNSSVDSWIKKTKGIIDYPQFARIIFEGISSYMDNIFFPLVYRLIHINKLSNYFIYRIKINMNFPYPNNNNKNYGPIHHDLIVPNKDCPKAKEAISIIYYINNTDGDTVFFNKKLKEIKRVSPRQGRAVIFDSSINHAGSCPIYSPCRQVINFVLYK
jgi:hypothetical protein|tara:strand:+ start:747 stop:1310 length:564 start_codon:yes stop_codon:yes gene_type:complete